MSIQVVSRCNILREFKSVTSNVQGTVVVVDVVVVGFSCYCCGCGCHCCAGGLSCCLNQGLKKQPSLTCNLYRLGWP